MGRGLVFLYEDLHPHWVDLYRDSKLETLGVHMIALPGTNSVNCLIDALEKEGGRENIEALEQAGVKVEYELHAGEWLLPRDLFEEHPEYFRMNQDGVRTNDVNFCPANREALDIVADRAEKLAGIIRQKSHRYYLWLDDVDNGSCYCEHCRNLSSADQYILILEAILRGLRRYDPEAMLAFLAYGTVLTVPSWVPEGIFLEFAPMTRDHEKPITCPDDPRSVAYLELLNRLLKVFRAEEAEILEYWLDNALYSGYHYPPVKVPFHAAVCDADTAYYTSLGIPTVKTFASYIGGTYFDLHGEPPIREYGEILLKYIPEQP
ncbi:MAG: DUF4838 domain-containing protein [Clostridia bacterium]|nr:DUF4838 domain-containing protein [Clostridia bacterium]